MTGVQMNINVWWEKKWKKYGVERKVWLLSDTPEAGLKDYSTSRDWIITGSVGIQTVEEYAVMIDH